jgi:hypothetical protein
MERLWTIVGIAQMLGTTTADILALANHPAGTRQLLPHETWILGQICLLHGINPPLYRYNWIDHRGIFIASLPTGYRAWNIKHHFDLNAAWLGSISEIRPANEAEIELARASGWPYN